MNIIAILIIELILGAYLIHQGRSRKNVSIDIGREKCAP